MMRGMVEDRQKNCSVQTCQVPKPLSELSVPQRCSLRDTTKNSDPICISDLLPLRENRIMKL